MKLNIYMCSLYKTTVPILSFNHSLRRWLKFFEKMVEIKARYINHLSRLRFIQIENITFSAELVLIILSFLPLVYLQCTHKWNYNPLKHFCLPCYLYRLIMIFSFQCFYKKYDIRMTNFMFGLLQILHMHIR